MRLYIKGLNEVKSYKERLDKYPDIVKYYLTNFPIRLYSLESEAKQTAIAWKLFNCISQ